MIDGISSVWINGGRGHIRDHHGRNRRWWTSVKALLRGICCHWLLWRWNIHHHGWWSVCLIGIAPGSHHCWRIGTLVGSSNLLHWRNIRNHSWRILAPCRVTGAGLFRGRVRRRRSDTRAGIRTQRRKVMSCNKVWLISLRFLFRMQKQASLGVAFVPEFATSFLVSRQNTRDLFLRRMTFSATLFEGTFTSQKRDANITFSTG